MGLSISKADSSPPPLPSFSAANLGAAAQAALEQQRKDEAVDYLNLPAATKYEDLQREVTMALKPDLFEGMRFEITKPLNQNFFLSHSLFMGNIEMQTGGRQVIKTPIGNYEFGANVVNDKYMLLGRIATDGRLSGRVIYNFRDWLSCKLHCQLSNEPGQSQLMVDADVKGHDWNAQFKVGSPSFLGLNYFQSVTPKLSAGGEFFYMQANQRSGVGVALRHSDKQHVATLQLATTGVASLHYVHRVNEKVTLATDFLWHWVTREVTASVGYDCILRQCRLRGKVDTNGVFSALLEERFSTGINFLLSAELDHWNSNHRFGFGISVGE